MAADGRLPEMDRTTATRGLSVEACPAAEGPRRSSWRLNCACDECYFWIWLAMWPPLIFACVAIGIFTDNTPKPPRYSIAIDFVSGLDPATDLGARPTLDPVFSLTLRVASESRRESVCSDVGMYVQVAYRGVPLAASATATERLCAGPRNATQKPLVARGAGVAVPGSVLDSLAVDMRSGVEVFEVSLHGWGNMSLPCGPRRVGDADALLQKECTRAL